MNYAAKAIALCLLPLFVVVCCLPLAAQVQFGQITGDITDPAGAAVPNAKVAVKNPTTGLSVNAATNASGHFIATQLPPGQYTVSVTAQGFKTQTLNAVVVNAGSVSHFDVKLAVGQVSETVEVTGAAPQIDVETSRLAQVVTSEQVASLPLNGRNVFDLIQLVPGAVNVTGVDFENGHSTVVNGLRENFNGFLLNGVPNKGLSGGVNNTPIEDSVQEFQQLTLNMSSQYGNSAGSITNLVTKAGTNAWHGSGWEFIRNDALDANNFFLNRQPDTAKNPNCTAVGPGCPVFKPALRFNQFGGTFGGPIKKDKVFFFVSYQGDRFKTSAPPQSIVVESPEFRQAVALAFPNSTAALLYNNFAPRLSGTSTVSSASDFSGYTNPATFTDPKTFGLTLPQAQALATKFSTLFQAINSINPNMPIELNSVAVFPSQTQSLGNLFNGNEASGRIDYIPREKDRFFAQYNWLRSSDTFGPCNAACTRGFTNPTRGIFPNGQLSWVHTFSPKLINEVRAGYTQNNTVINAGTPGVPSIGFDDGTAGFGSYSGYPQFFKEHVYTYSDMVSVNKGSHNMKVGVDVKRNIENSEFNVARPSYYFFDPLFFSIDSPYTVSAGVDPGFISGTNQSALATNIRHWRNVELGAYFQDDWKATRKLTLNLGLRYDLFTRHSELNNQATTFILGPGKNIVDNVTTGAGQLRSANADCPNLDGVLAGVCGPGGFAKAKALGLGDHNNLGPRVGFAYDVFGNGKTSLRGGFGVSYESTLYNPLSNSRWNPPFYSFDSATNFLAGDVGTVVYGPSICNATGCTPSGAAPTFTGAPTNPGQGVGAQAVGNLVGWFPSNPHTANLTGIVFPKGIRDPYVYNYFLSVQHEIVPKLAVEIDYVGTAGHKLFRAEDVNRKPGAKLGGPGVTDVCAVDTFGRTLCGTGEPNGRINGNYGRMRVWENSVNSNYNSLQLAVKKQTSHGISFNFNYTWSHTIDEGSTWHSGATTANGAAAGEGFTTDPTLPRLDRGNAIFDIRHRVVANYVWELPLGKYTGAMQQLLGGWQLNGIWVWQTGPHWEPFDSRSFSRGGDFNADAVNNDRPNASIGGFSGATHDMWANGWGDAVVFSAPCPGCVGNLGRNTFVGPTDWYADMSLFKNFKLTERVGLQFRAEAFNIMNHTNFLLAASAAGTNAAHNRINSCANGDGTYTCSGTNFGQAGATLNSRNLQFGLKLSF